MAMRVEFDDSSSQVIDFTPILEGQFYRPLRDPTLFTQVRIDPEAHTLVWPNGADFDPATLMRTYRTLKKKGERRGATPGNLKEARSRVQGAREVLWQDRRLFLKTLMVGGSAAGLTLLFPTVGPRAAGQTDALLLSCMDFRLMKHTARYMQSRRLTNKYDHIMLAGAALGALTDKFPAWNQTFWDHLGVAIDLHKIQRVMLLDHRDCGAYKVILGEDFAKDPPKETAIHATHLRRLSKMIQEKYPALKVELLLMALDGKVEVISPSS